MMKFEKKLPSTDIKTLLVTGEMVEMDAEVREDSGLEGIA